MAYTLEDIYYRLGGTLQNTQDDARRRFQNKIFNKLDSYIGIFNKNRDLNYEFANNWVEKRLRDFTSDDRSFSFERPELRYKVISKHLYGSDFIEFLFTLEFLASKDIPQNFSDFLFTILQNASENLGFFWDKEQRKFYRAGAKELDKALVKEVLTWLKDFPEAEKNFHHALQIFSALEGEDQKTMENIVADLKKAWESLGKSICSSQEKNWIQKIFKTSQEDEWNQLFKTNNAFIHNFRHGQASNIPLTKHEVEYFLYFVGMCMRWIIQKNRQS